VEDGKLLRLEGIGEVGHFLLEAGPDTATELVLK